MKKYIVPGDKGFKLVAAHNPPHNAICEAPENFTDEMEPYFEIKEGVAPDGKPQFSVEVAKAFSERKLADQNKEIEKNLERAKSLIAAAHKSAEIRKYNQMKPHQRFVKNVFGDLLVKSKRPLAQKITKKIFKDKL